MSNEEDELDNLLLNFDATAVPEGEPAASGPTAITDQATAGSPNKAIYVKMPIRFPMVDSGSMTASHSTLSHPPKINGRNPAPYQKVDTDWSIRGKVFYGFGTLHELVLSALLEFKCSRPFSGRQSGGPAFNYRRHHGSKAERTSIQIPFESWKATSGRLSEIGINSAKGEEFEYRAVV